MPKTLAAIIALLDDETAGKMRDWFDSTSDRRIVMDLWDQLYNTHRHLDDLTSPF